VTLSQKHCRRPRGGAVSKHSTKQLGSEAMEEKQDQKSTLVEIAIKFALSLAMLFPVYAILYLTFPASVVAFYLISAALLAIFLPWDTLKKKFLS
jgi:hypothetical protein